ncbi:hypothetical protein TRFO_36460 [Tritrichomonas foetus]|uniref:Coiled-coil domain-containing protein 39 n=1 Tax=Tritrichomonas foetus TaxID=1144522 RepID=A0A1J4JIG4_9EUKA|nr:hypothetical protein TRFO_36460 [Tritrichomonas foetus]|eukprot:OHS97339.1 hypothetical protein TRFO_36460 [Tritrichomonas foetus]
MSYDPTINLYDQLPDFANKENRTLHADIVKKQSELQKLISDGEELVDRFNVIKDHLANVQIEVTTTQQLVTAKEAEVETEKHLQQLAFREIGKIQTDLKKIEDKMNDVQAKNSQVEAKTFKSQQRIEVFKEEAKMNEEELAQWVQAARDKEEDFLVIQRYKKEDEGRIRSMLLEIEKATAVIEAKKNELDQEVTTTRALQIELDMTAEQFRKLHEERAHLLAQWEQTLQKMQSLNQEIEQTTNIFESRKGEVTKYNGLVQEGKKNLEMAESENQRFERKLTISDNQVSSKHKELENEVSGIDEFEKHVETQRHKLDKLESDERAYHEEIEELRRKTQEQYNKKEYYIQRLQETQNALDTQKDNTEELTEQTNVMNEFLKKEEEELATMERNIDNEKNTIFKLSQEVYKARKVEKNLLAEIQGSQSRAKNLQLKIQEFDRETQKQMELLYNSNFQIQQMERKISRIEGDRTEEEKVELQAQIDQLSKILESKIVTEKMLAQQLHRLDLDLRQTARRKSALEETQKDLDIRLTELRLDQDSLDKSTVKARTTKESVLVQINMLRLQVEKLSDQVNLKCDELISLENRRQQLQLSMAERVAEIDTHLAALRVQLKTEEEARHQAVIELQERKRRCDTLSSKYQVLMGKYKIEGEEVTQTYHVIKFAQEREEIAQKGDQLEEQVKKAIKELRALEKAMNKLNGQNADFRGTFTAVGENDSDFERKKSLEEQRKVAQQRLNSRRSEAQAVAEEKEAMRITYQDKMEKIQIMNEEIKKIDEAIKKLVVANKETDEKVKRASNAMTRAKETHRKTAKIAVDAPYPSSLFEMDVEIHQHQHMLDQTIQELTQIAASNREIEPKLNLGLSQIGLQMAKISGVGSRQVGRTPQITTPLSGRSTSSTRSGNSMSSKRSQSSVGSVSSGQGSVGSVVSIGADLPDQVSYASGSRQGSRVGSRPGSQASNRPGSVRSNRSQSSLGSQASNRSQTSHASSRSNVSAASKGSVRSNASAASKQSFKSNASAASGASRPITPRRKTQITTPQIGGPGRPI